MTFLLDVNVLISLIDGLHVHHDPAHRWFHAIGRKQWATCPFTENAVLRIVGSPAYFNSPGTPAVVSEILTALCALPGHVFWHDDLSLMDCPVVDPSRFLHSAQLSDTYLLALAVTHGGQLATFDRRLVVNAVRDGANGLHVIR
jgi:toxin-antitoxin system PIN domain toxin